jgi:hypothetical protein
LFGVSRQRDLPKVIAMPERYLRERRHVCQRQWRHLAASTPIAPDADSLKAVADRLDYVIANGDREQAKALLPVHIAGLPRKFYRPTAATKSHSLFADKKSGRNLAVRKPCGDGGAGGRGRLMSLSAVVRQLGWLCQA